MQIRGGSKAACLSVIFSLALVFSIGVESTTAHAAVYHLTSQGSTAGTWVVVTADDPGSIDPGLYFMAAGSKDLRPVRLGKVDQIVANHVLVDQSAGGTMVQTFANNRLSSNAAVVEVNDGIYWLGGSGQIQPLMTHPSENAVYLALPNGARNIDVYSFVSDARNYTLVRSIYSTRLGEHIVNVVAIVRDDGVSVTVPVLCAGKVSFEFEASAHVDDGMLRIPGAVRSVDLRAFEIEAQFLPVLPQPVKDSQNEDLYAIDAAEKEFKDVMTTPDLLAGAFESPDPAEFDPLVEAFFSKMIGSAVVLGAPGVGKTEYLKSFFMAVKAGLVPGIPRSTWVPLIDTSSLEQGTKYKGVFEQRMAALTEASRVRPTIWFVDELHALRGAGTHSEKSADMMQSLKPMLASGRLHIFGTDTFEEYEEAFLADAALDQRFARIERKEFDHEQSLEAIRVFAKRAHGGEFKPEVVDEIYRLSQEFNAVDANPRKANRLVDKIGARARRTGRTLETYTIDDVRKVAQDLYQVDPAHFSEEGRRSKIEGFRAALDEHILGHTEIKDSIHSLLVQSFTGVSDPRQPRVRVLLAGGRGLGKTELGFAVAKALGYPFHRVEMNRFANSDSGADDLRREIATQLTKNAFTVFLLDEIEKAAPMVQNALLGILDNGMFGVRHKSKASDKAGKLVQANARNAIFITTTNAAQERSYAKTGGSLTRRTVGFGAGPGQVQAGAPTPSEPNAQQKAGERAAVFRDIVADGVSEYLLDRHQAVWIAKAFDQEEFRAIVRSHIQRFVKQQKQERGREVKFLIPEDQILDAIVAEFYTPRVSGRDAIRGINERIRNWYAQALFSQQTDSVELCEKLLLGK